MGNFKVGRSRDSWREGTLDCWVLNSKGFSIGRVGMGNCLLLPSLPGRGGVGGRVEQLKDLGGCAHVRGRMLRRSFRAAILYKSFCD